MRLYNTLLRPILEYPAVPICIASKSNIMKMQRFQNVSLKQCAKGNRDDAQQTIEELHQRFKVQTINCRLFDLANKIWDHTSLINPILTDSSRLETTTMDRTDHSWWPRIDPYVNGRPPDPVYMY